MVTLCQQLAEGMADIAPIQEPWIYRGQIRGTVFSVVLVGNVRSCIFVKNYINALLLLEFCCSDATTVRITRGGD
jgi:hypothetical protein